MAAEMKIGQLAKTAGTAASTIRYYEEIGLLPAPARQAGSQRTYGEADLRRLTFIRRCRDFGFGIEQTRQLASLVADRERSCLEAQAVAQAHLEEVRSKLRELKALERSISAFVHDCASCCVGGPGADCVILEELAEPAPARSSSSRTKAARGHGA